MQQNWIPEHKHKGRMQEHGHATQTKTIGNTEVAVNLSIGKFFCFFQVAATVVTFLSAIVISITPPSQPLPTYCKVI